MHSIGRNAGLIREYLTRNFGILRDTNVLPKTNLAASVDVQMESGCSRGDLDFFSFLVFYLHFTLLTNLTTTTTTTTANITTLN